MQNLISRTFISVSLLCISGVSLANNITVYRWVDENNVVHFSQNQPGHNNYTELTLANFEKNKPKMVAQKVKSDRVSNKQASPQSLNSDSNKCEEAKANVKTLKAYDNIQYTDSTGTVQVLSDLEKSQQLEINEKHVEVYCAQ
ncbi:DUF4124 domain-containing protein [Thalassotalea sp. G2M2-11]|uniref:DUF4124 domain-containing protein n=1 Tax=Thalassotalea sp. G2M2-11 TaxID=2787627 RepID=UPI0019D08CC3|nr:DUF4124 domain-containing protein [Thalassotalea sp. G2M2-11]